MLVSHWFVMTVMQRLRLIRATRNAATAAKLTIKAKCGTIAPI
jgi:hypothetical protein